MSIFMYLIICNLNNLNKKYFVYAYIYIYILSWTSIDVGAIFVRIHFLRMQIIIYNDQNLFVTYCIIILLKKLL